MRNYLPINLDVTDKKILVVGGGNVALQKIEGVLKFSSNITVISPEILSGIRVLGLNLIEREYAPGDSKGYALVYICTNMQKLNQLIREDARLYNVLVCVADDPENCDFISPAVYKDGHMIVAVSSSGKDVRNAISWRNKIRELFTPSDL